MDYVTLSGISERTGIDKNNLPKFVLKELHDNDVDFIEGQGPVSKKEKSDSDKITVTFDINSSEGQQHCPVLKVRNSVRNNNIQITFNKEKLKQIFDFSKYHSTKRNLFTISRGVDRINQTVSVEKVTFMLCYIHIYQSPQAASPF